MTDDMIERMKQSFAETGFDWPNDERLRAALEAALSGTREAVEPVGGWVMVPREPTEAMLDAADRHVAVLQQYRAMIAAAPPSDPVGQGAVTDAIYTASKTTHAAKWRELRSNGVPVISTWIDEAGVGETSCFIDLWTRCVREASSAKAVVLYREPGEVLKGAFIEAGAALANGVPVFTVGCEEFSFVNHPLVTQCVDLNEAIRCALALSPAPEAGSDEVERLRAECDQAKRIATNENDRANRLAAIIRDCPEARSLWGERIVDEAASDMEGLTLSAELTALRDQLGKMREAAKAYHEVTQEYFSDSKYDADGNLSKADAELFGILYETRALSDAAEGGQ